MKKHKKGHGKEQEAHQEQQEQKAGYDNKDGDITIPVVEYHKIVEKAKLADEYHDRYMRAVAEFDNFKKRVSKDRADLLKYSNTEFIKGLLPILDNFDRAIMTINDSSDAHKVKEGIDIIVNQFHKYLEGLGLKMVTAVGEEFDPHKHEAVMSVETEDHPDNAVVEELQKGYTLNDRLIRPSMVKVAKNHGVESPEAAGDSDNGE